MNKRPRIFLFVFVFGLMTIVGLLWTHVRKSLNFSHKEITAAVQQNSWADESGDTNNEVLRTVVANQQKLQKQNQKLQQENDELRQNGIKTIQRTIEQSNQSLENQLTQEKSALEEKMVQQKRTITDLQEKLHQNSGSYEVNGMDEETNGNVIREVPDLSHVRVMNSSKLLKSDNSPTLPSDSENTKQQTIPYYTIPANSTLNHVSLMTSIIGEVPVSGHLVAPAFPFKAIVGRKDLFAANGLSIPSNIAGMVLSGYSVGNMTMSCARAYVTQILFVFKDGHFVVFPKKAESDATALYPTNALGYLSDPYGNTCISGKYITDAPKVITNMAAMGGIAAGASAVSQAQMTTMTNAFQTNTQLTGDLAKYMGGAFVNGAAQKALDWYASRVSDVFDAVFIPAACKNGITKLVFNVTQTIPIDFDKTGRTLRYENNQFHHSHQLD